MKQYPNNTSKPISVTGLKSATQDDIDAMIKFYKQKGYKVEHKTHLDEEKELPYNGVLVVDRRRKYLI